MSDYLTVPPRPDRRRSILTLGNVLFAVVLTLELLAIFLEIRLGV